MNLDSAAMGGANACYLSDEWPVLAVGADWSTHWNMIQAFDDMDKGLIG